MLPTTPIDGWIERLSIIRETTSCLLSYARDFELAFILSDRVCTLCIQTLVSTKPLISLML